MQKTRSTYYFKTIEDAIPCIVHPCTEYFKLIFSPKSDCEMRWNEAEQKIQFLSCTSNLVNGSDDFRITKVFFEIDEFKSFPQPEKIVVRNDEEVDCVGEREIVNVVDWLGTLKFLGEECVIFDQSNCFLSQTKMTLTLQNTILQYNPNLAPCIGHKLEMDLLETRYGEDLSRELVIAYKNKQNQK